MRSTLKPANFWSLDFFSVEKLGNAGEWEVSKLLFQSSIGAAADFAKSEKR